MRCAALKQVQLGQPDSQKCCMRGLAIAQQRLSL